MMILIWFMPMCPFYLVVMYMILLKDKEYVNWAKKSNIYEHQFI